MASFLGLLKTMVGITISNPYGTPYRPQTVSKPTPKECFMYEWLTVDIIRQEAEMQRTAYSEETEYIQTLRFVAAIVLGTVTYFTPMYRFALPVFLSISAWAYIIRPLQVEEPRDQAHQLKRMASRIYDSYERAYNEFKRDNADDEAYTRFALDKSGAITDLHFFQAMNKIYPVGFSRTTAEDSFHRAFPNPW